MLMMRPPPRSTLLPYTTHFRSVVLEVDVEVREDQLVLDELPDDRGHLVAVEPDDGALDLDLRHVRVPLYMLRAGSAQRSATSACLARTASAASRNPASSLSDRSPSTTRRTPSRPISASTPR